MSKLRWLICSLILVATALAQDTGGKLKMAVIVTRHGVRPPLSKDTSSPYARDLWPSLTEWGTRCPGDLTPTGYNLAKLMGRYYSGHYHQLLHDRCPAGQTYIYADNEERTMGTAEGIAQGLAAKFPGCNVEVDWDHDLKPPDPKDAKSSDPCDSPYKTDDLFHPLQKFGYEVSKDEIQKILDDIKQRAPGLRTKYAAQLTSLQNVVICCDASQCKSPGECTLLTLPDKFELGDDGKFKWTGPFSVGSTATENFLLEYADGMPCNIVGWRRVSFDYTSPDCSPRAGEPFKQMQTIHTVYFEQVNRAPYLAKIQGSNLANQVLLQLEAGVEGKTSAPLVIYAGHDTNLANIAGMLNLSWSLTDLPENDTPPAGALVFELYERAPRDFYVKIRYVHATMTQMRTQALLSAFKMPEWSDVKVRQTTIPYCSNPCSFAKFEAMMKAAIDLKFTTPGPSMK